MFVFTYQCAIHSLFISLIFSFAQFHSILFLLCFFFPKKEKEKSTQAVAIQKNNKITQKSMITALACNNCKQNTVLYRASKLQQDYDLNIYRNLRTRGKKGKTKARESEPSLFASLVSKIMNKDHALLSWTFVSQTKSSYSCGYSIGCFYCHFAVQTWRKKK